MLIASADSNIKSILYVPMVMMIIINKTNHLIDDKILYAWNLFCLFVACIEFEIDHTGTAVFRILSHSNRCHVFENLNVVVVVVVGSFEGQ